MKKSRKSISVNVGRWISYAAAGAVTAMAASSDADAAILYSGVLNLNLKGNGGQFGPIKTLISNSHPGTQVVGNVVHYLFQLSPNGASNGSAGTAVFQMLAAKQGKLAGMNFGSPYASRLAAGVNLGAQAFIQGTKIVNVPTTGQHVIAKSVAYMDYASYNNHSQWRAGQQGFLGFEFNLGGGVQYGWADVQMHHGTLLNPGGANNPSCAMTLISYAYGTPGQAILTGQTPEPSALALFALGASGLAALRRRLKRQNAAEEVAA